MILVGTYHHQVDEKGRFRIPVKFKKAFEKRDEDGDYLPLFIMKGTNKCLFVYTEETAEKLFFSKFDGVDFTSEDGNSDIRNFTANAMWAERDPQGRIGISEELLKFAGIQKGIVSVGVYNHVEIWGEEEWQKYGNGGASTPKE